MHLRRGKSLFLHCMSLELADGVEKVGGEVRWDLAVGLMTSVGLIGISGLAHAGFGLDAHATN